MDGADNQNPEFGTLISLPPGGDRPVLYRLSDHLVDRAFTRTGRPGRKDARDRNQTNCCQKAAHRSNLPAPDPADRIPPVNDLPDDGLTRCAWADSSEMMRSYHDDEWGRPIVGEQDMFERLSLEAFQAGLSWATILRKRLAFREAFREFDLDYCVGLTETGIEDLMGNAAIIRARAKIEATRENAIATITLREDGGLVDLIGSFAPAASPAPSAQSEVPTRSPESEMLAKELRRRGFKFVGPTNMYALMEAVGLVNTHLIGCFRRHAA